MKIVHAVTLLAVLGYGVQARAAPDCDLGQHYVDLAREHVAASEENQAEALLQQAIAACPSYQTYQSLGELEARSSRRTEKMHAVDAFLSAYELASSDQTRAKTLYNYADLLNRDGDPQNAYPLIRDAQILDTKDPDIAQLSAQIQRQVSNPTQEHLTRGLWNSLYKPLRIASAAPAVQGARLRLSEGPSVNIPINFETGSVMVDEQTRANIATLAHALSDPEHTEQRYLFVGHADVRGNEAQNVELSKRRAETLCEGVILLVPSLQGRIEVTGRGSSEPIDPAHTEAAYRANRRLQVLLK